MSRTPFIVGTALVCVAATVVAVRLMPSAETLEEVGHIKVGGSVPIPTASASTNPELPTYPISRSDRPSSERDEMVISLETFALARVPAENRPQVSRILGAIQRKSAQKLDALTETYALTRKQRKAIFPLLVAYDSRSHPAILMGGQPLPSPTVGQTLDESIFEELSPEQRDILTGETIERDAWWSEIATQLEDDLDRSLSANVSVAPTARAEAHAVPGIISSPDAAQGDGQASDHSGGNLFDLLGGN